MSGFLRTARWLALGGSVALVGAGVLVGSVIAIAKEDRAVADRAAKLDACAADPGCDLPRAEYADKQAAGQPILAALAGVAGMCTAIGGAVIVASHWPSARGVR